MFAASPPTDPTRLWGALRGALLRTDPSGAPRTVLADAHGLRLTGAEAVSRVERLGRALPDAAEGPATIAISAAAPLDLLLGVLAAWSAGHGALPLDPKLPVTVRHLLAERAQALALLLDGGLAVASEARRGVPLLRHAVLEAGGLHTLWSRDLHSVEAALALTAQLELPWLRSPKPARGSVALLGAPSGASTLLGQALPALLCGAGLVLVSDLAFPSARLDVMAREGACGVAGAPAALRALAEAALDRAPAARPPLVGLLSTGAAVEPADVERWARAFPGARLWDVYGTCPAGPVLCVREVNAGDTRELNAGDMPDGPGLQPDRLGPPLPGVALRRGAGDALEVASPAAACPEEGAPASWLSTGDRLRPAAPGSEALELAGRTDDLVTLGDRRYSLRALEAALATAPGIEALRLVAEPAPRGGHRLRGYYQTLLPSSDIGPELTRLARAALPEAARPVALHAVPAFPRTPEGDVDDASLKDLTDGEHRN